ncbi:MAG: hypothetical protein RLZZ562_779 [Planctomycetota bacterium]
MKRLIPIAAVSFYAVAMLPLAGCEGDKSAAPAAAHDHDHDHAAADHDHAAADHDHAAAGHDHAAASQDPAKPNEGHEHGTTTELGEQESGGFKVKASRDGSVKAGVDAAIDVWVNGGKAGNAVRFWIGTEDAKGSIKAKAEVEVDHWHTHAEVPNPLPAGSKLWVEVDGDGGAKAVVSFDLKL